MKKLITLEQLHNLLHYDPETGVFTWRTTNKYRREIKVGDRAGYADAKGYWLHRVNGATYLAHRLAWFYVHGEWPPHQVDHINGIRDDNRISNLRLATRTQNARNRALRSDNTSGHAGIHFDKRDKNWRVQSSLNGRNAYVGIFATLDEAITAREQFTAAHWGEFKPTVARKVSDRIAPLFITTEGLEELGFPATEQDESQFDAMARAMAAHLRNAVTPAGSTA